MIEVPMTSKFTRHAGSVVSIALICEGLELMSISRIITCKNIETV